MIKMEAIQKEIKIIKQEWEKLTPKIKQKSALALLASFFLTLGFYSMSINFWFILFAVLGVIIFIFAAIQKIKIDDSIKTFSGIIDQLITEQERIENESKK